MDMVLAHLRNPTLEQLLTYHSILVWSNACFHDPESLGDVLADAADEGIGVVLCAYSARTSGEAAERGMAVAGRLWQQYRPCTRGYVESGTELVLVPNRRTLEAHPECREILEGASGFSGGQESVHQALERLNGVEMALTVAEWSNAVPAVLVNLPTGRRRSGVVVWNCRPGSSDVSEHGWKAGQSITCSMLLKCLV